MSGLTKRVRGANALVATNVADAFNGGEAFEAAGPTPSPDSVASFLSALGEGVERGIHEADEGVQRS